MIALVTGTNSSLGIDGVPYPLRGIFPSWDAANEKMGLAYSDGVSRQNLVPLQGFANFTLDGDTCASFADLVTFAEAAFFLSSGGGGAAFEATALTGSGSATWDGTHKYRVLTSNLDVTLDTTRTSGTLTVWQLSPGGFSLSINGEDIPIEQDAGAVCVVSFLEVAGSRLYKVDVPEVEEVLPVPDVTPPTVVSFVAINANTLTLTLSEAASGTLTGIAVNNITTAAPVLLDGFVGGGTNTWTITTLTTMNSSDSYGFVITGSDIEDGAGNLLADDSGGVTNSIASGSTEALTWQSPALEASPGAWVFSKNTYGAAYAADQTQTGAGRLVADASSRETILGFAPTSFTSGGYASYTAAMLFDNAGAIAPIDGGVPGSVVAVPGGTSHVGISVSNGGAFEIETSPDGTTWTQLMTISATVTGGSTLKILGCDSNNNSHLDNPIGENVS